MKEKFITTNELANDTSKILRNLKNGGGVVILRYSDPVGVLISYEDYKKIQTMESDFVRECRVCLGTIKKSQKNKEEK